MNTRSITPLPPADFTPEQGNYKTLQPFRYWCQKVLPLVYDDSLSYYELLCKVVDYLNKTMEDVETLQGDVTNLYNAYIQLQQYVNDYFKNLDVQEEINKKLDEMVKNGTLAKILAEYLTAFWYNVKLFGADNTGTTPCDDIINDGLESGLPVYFSPGTYLINKPICIKNNILIGDNATIKASSSFSGEAIIILNNENIEAETYKDLTRFKITGLTITGNSEIDGILLNQGFSSYISYCNITDCKNGLTTRKEQSLSGGEYHVNYVTFERCANFGINDNGYDNFFNDIACIDCNTGIYTNNGVFSNVKIWLSDPLLYINNARGILVGTSFPLFNCVTLDTLPIGIEISGYNNIAINGLQVIHNLNVIVPVNFPTLIKNDGNNNEGVNITDCRINLGASMNLTFMSHLSLKYRLRNFSFLVSHITNNPFNAVSYNDMVYLLPLQNNNYYVSINADKINITLSPFETKAICDDPLNLTYTNIVPAISRDNESITVGIQFNNGKMNFVNYSGQEIILNRIIYKGVLITTNY